MFGFQRLPRLYDAFIGVAFPLGATDLTKPVAPGPGNVLRSLPRGNRTDGKHGSSVIGLLNNARARFRAREVPSTIRHDDRPGTSPCP
jgi:hypothetical protein